MLLRLDDAGVEPRLLLYTSGWPGKIVIASGSSHSIQSRALRSAPFLEQSAAKEFTMAIACQSCGNARSFLVKTLQMHVVHLEGARVEVAEENRPAVFEVLCDECEAALNIDEFDDEVRREILLVLGAR